VRQLYLSLEARNELISNIFDAVLEGLGVASVPVGLSARHSVLAREPDEKNIVFTVAVVSSEAVVWVAHVCKGYGGLSGRGAAVGIAPDAVEL
jgi:hypothetical protein